MRRVLRRSGQPSGEGRTSRRRRSPKQPRVTSWSPIAEGMWHALRTSGQSVFYEQTDWALGFALCESMSREFKPIPTVIGRGESAEVVELTLPPKAASLASWSKMCTTLLVAEGDRRRAGLELTRAEPEGEDADVSDFAAYRSRSAG